MTKGKASRIIAALLIAAFMTALCASFVASGFCADGFAFVADSYGGTDAAGLWYYGKDALDVYGAKEISDGWELPKGDPVVIAVVDTGMTTTHELFDDVLLKNEAGEVLFDNSTVADGGNVDISDKSTGNHGNKVAGVIAMLIHEFELEDYIKIYPIKASVVSGNEDKFPLYSVTEAINRAVTKANADVINLSIYLQYSEQNAEWATDAQHIYAIQRASQSALIVAATGNSGKKATDPLSAEAAYPAAQDGVFSVMGYDKNGSLYENSNYGSIYDIAAPAEGVFTSTSSGYVSNNSGTSLAAAMVSFASALLKLRYRAEGLADPSPQQQAMMLKSFAFDSFDYGGVEDIHMLNLRTMLEQPLDEVELIPSAPTGIKLSHDGQAGEGKYADSVYYVDPRNVPELNFVATLSPYGMTDPDFDALIEWSLRDSSGAERTLGRGKTLTFKPEIFGDTELVARLNVPPNISVEGVQKIHIEYLRFAAGDARVTLEKYAETPPREAPTSGVLYTNETTVFTFTGSRYVDPTVEIKWYVDREYVASGRTFAYRPKSAGTHLISMQFGDQPPTHTPGIAFVADVKPFILRPLDLSMLIVGLTIALAGGTTLVVLRVKHKRETDPKPPREKKPPKPKKQKKDKNIKIAKR